MPRRSPCPTPSASAAGGRLHGSGAAPVARDGPAVLWPRATDGYSAITGTRSSTCVFGATGGAPVESAAIMAVIVIMCTISFTLE
jgi:hypothetical protein